ncbi:pyruvate dehydrogenase E2 component (dihydrolipoamide acetyltransferase) [Nonomuraea thailandensis]|uniref:Dihydrolipoamide acetyltransferase component of pyruvate dehydrogenase complex n=1 Tax=Nonomuraea thailandensis TaxID=1188745 RepID=A0A9X2GK24_9ACTN|nr:dihydrolipoamide acetyltransferase family protein [Nonomuraea thailandensis]MCP2355648.1 pyruvate dehydrogenase E2 component (dihydrolipoamide acetyltransferase) [Nonomuraea thailandensis]
MNTLEAQLFRLPDLGEGLTEAEVVIWKVAAGDTVEIDQIVVEVETAKAAVEVPVPYAGTVLELHAEAGTTLSVGDPLISVGASAPVPDRGPGTAAEAGPDVAAERYREEERAGSGNVLIGYGTGHLPGQRRRRRGRPGTASSHTAARAEAAPVAARVEAGSAGTGRLGVAVPPVAVPAAGTGRGQAPRVISPLVRRLAQENGVDLAGVTPSGPNRVILRRDVERAIAEPREPAAEPRPGRPAAITGRTPQPDPPAPSPQPDPPALSPRHGAPAAAASAQEPERIPLRGLRRAVAEKLSRSRSEIPDATTWVDVDATALLETKDALRAAVPDRRIGLLALLARICVAGLRRYPELNSTVDLERAEIVRYPWIHLGFAAQTERGLVVPVVRDAHRMTLTELAAELARLTALAREGALPPQALTGGTFTLNNYGVFGVDGSTPIINHPEAALLGIGRIIDRPWAVDGALAVRKITQLSFTFDHRVCDGGVAGGFLRYVADCVERPATLLADL